MNTLIEELFNTRGKPVGSCEWRDLIFMNYPVPAAVLKPYLPAGTELDLWEGQPWLSLVALTFKSTRVLHIPLPGQQDYVQVNLRFYVKHQHEDEVRKG